MKTPLAVSIALGLVVPLAVGATVSWGSSTTTECWDEYNKRGTRFYRTVTPKDLPMEDRTPANTCLFGYRADGRQNRLYVPHGADPATACEDAAPATTTAPPATTTAPPATEPTAHFATLPVGAELPSDAECASQVRPMSENRPDNAVYNATPGDGANSTDARVTGDFTGTTDEIIQWTACKWGIDEDWVRAQIANESGWNQTTLGDFTSNPEHCIPGFGIGNYDPQWNGDVEHIGQCPESIGLGQVRWLYHQSAFANDNAVKSSAYNLDYTYSIWRNCFEGQYTWLNNEGPGTYAAGDAKGCLGVWFAGRWYNDAAIGYIDRFDQTLNGRNWEQDWFGPASPESGTQPITTTPPKTVGVPTITVAPTPTTAPPAPTTAPPTAPPTTAAPTVPPTTPPPTTPPSTGAARFVETFDGNSGLDRWRWGVYHRGVAYHEAGTPMPLGADNNALTWGSWGGDHDLDCGSPDTQRTLKSESWQDTAGANGWKPTLDLHTDELVYLCRDHLMTSMGDVGAYSIVWFAPDMVFDDVSSVAFDVNLTDLGNRQWWKVGVVSDALYNSTTGSDWNGAVQVPGFITSDVGAAGLDGKLEGPDRMIATWSGGASAGYPGALKIGDRRVNGGFSADDDKRTRHPVALVDNQDGTVTFNVAGSSATVSGSFPECPCRVVFYDHNYTPDKDGTPIGHTWHWDNFVIR